MPRAFKLPKLKKPKLPPSMKQRKPKSPGRGKRPRGGGDDAGIGGVITPMIA